MATSKYQGFPTYRYAQIALKGSNKSSQDARFGDTAGDSDKGIEEGKMRMDADERASSVQSNNEVFEVDYEHDVTTLYQAISSSHWNEALETLKSSPQEARTWVVRYKEDDTKGIMWRFLPIHSACARQPPHSVIASLIRAYSKGAESCDDQGMYPLHYASGNQASAEVIRLLIEAFPDAANICDPNGMLPIHYMAQWGPSEVKAIDALLLANQQTNIKDDEGNTALYYAEEGDCPYRQEMIAALKEGPISGTPKKKFNQALPLPPTSRRNLNPMTPTKSVPPTLTTTREQPSSVISELDGSVSNSSAMKDFFNQSNGDTANKMGNNSYTNPYPQSANKTVNRLTAQVNKLKADLEFHSAEYEETLTNQREEHEQSMEELNSNIEKAMNDNVNVKKDTHSKKEYGEYVQNRITCVETDTNHYVDQNERLEKELARYQEEFRAEKERAESFQMKIKTLSSRMTLMIEDQINMERSLATIENDMNSASEKRKKKLQELFDEEMKYTKELMTKQKVYGEVGPTIRAALNQQKSIMESCVLVLSECEDKENLSY